MAVFYASINEQTTSTKMAKMDLLIMHL